MSSIDLTAEKAATHCECFANVHVECAWCKELHIFQFVQPMLHPDGVDEFFTCSACMRRNKVHIPCEAFEVFRD